jgi:hypothetical protein
LVVIPAYHYQLVRTAHYVAATPGVAPTPGIAPVTSVDLHLGWNADAVSVAPLSGDGDYRFKLSTSNVGVVVGLNSTNADTGYTEIDFGIYGYHGFYEVYENGVSKYGPFAYVGTDEFKIERVAGVVKYYLNGTLKYTSATVSGGVVFLDCSMYSGGDVINEAAIDIITAASTHNGGTATSGASTTLTQTGAGWVPDQWIGAQITIISGTGAGQTQTITSNTATTVTVGTAWGTTPDNTSVYLISWPATASAAFAPLTGLGTQGLTSYTAGSSAFAPLGGAATGGLIVPKYTVAGAAFLPLLSSATGELGSTTLSPTSTLGDSTAAWTDNQWGDGTFTVEIIAGTDAGDSFTIVMSSFQVLYIDGTWTVPLDNTSQYVIRDGDGNIVYQSFVTVGSNSFKPLTGLGANYAYKGAFSSFTPLGGRSIAGFSTTAYALLKYGSYHFNGSILDHDPTSIYGTVNYDLTARTGHQGRLAYSGYHLTASATVPNVARVYASARYDAYAHVVSGTISYVSARYASYGMAARLGDQASGRYAGYAAAAHVLNGGLLHAALRYGSYGFQADVTQGQYIVVEGVLPGLRAVNSGLVSTGYDGYSFEALVNPVKTVLYEAYCVNLRAQGDDDDPRFVNTVNAVTRFTNFPFNQIVRYNGKYFGLASDGIYELTGNTDNGSPIAWRLRLHETDYRSKNLKRARSVYLGGRMKNSVQFTVHSGEDADSTQPTNVPLSVGARSARAVLPKGLRSRWFSYSLADPKGGELNLASLDAEVNVLDRTM